LNPSSNQQIPQNPKHNTNKTNSQQQQQQQKSQNTHHNNNNNEYLCNLETRSGGHAGPAHPTISHEIRLFALKKCCFNLFVFLEDSF